MIGDCLLVSDWCIVCGDQQWHELNTRENTQRCEECQHRENVSTHYVDRMIRAQED